MAGSLSFPRPRTRRGRRALAILGGTASLAFVIAPAAGLGGADGQGRDAGTATIARCDTDGVDVSYVDTYSPLLRMIRITGVVVSGISTACAGEDLEVTLSDISGDAIATGVAVSISGATTTVTIDAPGADAAAVARASVVISG